MNRPRFTISVLRGLLDMNSLASAELASFSADEVRDLLHGSGRDYDRAAQWLLEMQAWYRSKEEQS